MPIYTSGALLSDPRLTGHMGASTNEDTPRLSALALNTQGVYFANLPALEMPGTDEITYPTPINTDDGGYPWQGAWLPTLLLDAQGEALISSITGGMKLPSLTVSALAGSVLDTNISALSLSGAGSFTQPATLDSKISDLRILANTAARSAVLKLPTAELEISISGDLTGRLDRMIPGLSISATGSGGPGATLLKDLPPISITLSMTGSVDGNLSGKMPGIKISATASLNDYGSLESNIPTLIMTAGTAHQPTVSIDSKISTLLMQIIGSGMGEPGSMSVAGNSTRFTDYVLRYSR